MTEVYSNKNALYESMLKKAETFSGYPAIKIDKKVYANPIYKHAFQYYDSPVINSHLYPNMYLIRPFETGFIPSDDQVYKSIEARKKYAIGPHVLTNRELKVWS